MRGLCGPARPSLPSKYIHVCVFVYVCLCVYVCSIVLCAASVNVCLYMCVCIVDGEVHILIYVCIYICVCIVDGEVHSAEDPAILPPVPALHPAAHRPGAGRHHIHPRAQSPHHPAETVVMEGVEGASSGGG